MNSRNSGVPHTFFFLGGMRYVARPVGAGRELDKSLIPHSTRRDDALTTETRCADLPEG